MDTSKNRARFSLYQSEKFKPISSLLIVIICSLGMIVAACGDNSTGTNGDNGNGNGDNGNGEEPPPPEPTFTNVQEIFESSCSGSGCHIGERTNGVRLDSYDNVMESEGQQYGELVVQEGDADDSPLVDKIESANPEYGVRMPEGGPYLSDDEIDLIKEWIDDGAEDN